MQNIQEASVAIVIQALFWHASWIFTKCIFFFFKLQRDHTVRWALLLDLGTTQNTDKCLNRARFCSVGLLNSARFLWHLQTPKPTYTETFKEQEPLKIHLHFLFSSSWVSIRPSKSVTKALNVKTQFNTKEYWQKNTFILHTLSQCCFNTNKWVIMKQVVWFMANWLDAFGLLLVWCHVSDKLSPPFCQ